MTGPNGQNGSAGRYRDAYRDSRFPRMTTACWFSQEQFRADGDAAAVRVHRAQLPRAPRYAGQVGA